MMPLSFVSSPFVPLPFCAAGMRKGLIRLVALWLLAVPVGASAGAYDDMLNAMKQNDTERIMALLQLGMDVNTSDRAGNTLLMMAARNGQQQLVVFLLKNNANVLSRNKYGDTALMLAALEGRASAVRALLQAGSDIDPKGG